MLDKKGLENCFSFHDPTELNATNISSMYLDHFAKEAEVSLPKRLGSRCVLIAARDNSGSMGIWEVKMIENFLFWYRMILNRLYGYVQEEYIVHGTNGYYLGTDYIQFLDRPGSGGTIVSSGFDEILKRADQHFASDVYVVYASDGDNLTSDCERVIEKIKELSSKVRYIAYFETNQYNRSSTIRSVFRHAIARGEFPGNYNQFVLRSLDEMMEAINALFTPILFRSFGGTNLENEHRLSSMDEFY